jgi:hypothetical protein
MQSGKEEVERSVEATKEELMAVMSSIATCEEVPKAVGMSVFVSPRSGVVVFRMTLAFVYLRLDLSQSHSPSHHRHHLITVSTTFA